MIGMLATIAATTIALGFADKGKEKDKDRRDNKQKPRDYK